MTNSDLNKTANHALAAIEAMREVERLSHTNTKFHTIMTLRDAIEDLLAQLQRYAKETKR